jgi:hypothetical protein
MPLLTDLTPRRSGIQGCLMHLKKEVCNELAPIKSSEACGLRLLCFQPGCRPSRCTRILSSVVYLLPFISSGFAPQTNTAPGPKK